MSSTITLGLAEIKAGEASSVGTMPNTMSKIGKTYKDSCSITQDASDVTEHFEEGKAAPEVRKKTKKMPVLKFQLMDCDVNALADLVGGEVSDNVWTFDGKTVNANKAISVVTEQGLCFDIPNGDIEAVFNANLSSTGLMLVDVTVTPMSVTNNKAIIAKPLTVAS